MERIKTLFHCPLLHEIQDSWWTHCSSTMRSYRNAPQQLSLKLTGELELLNSPTKALKGIQFCQLRHFTSAPPHWGSVTAQTADLTHEKEWPRREENSPEGQGDSHKNIHSHQYVVAKVWKKEVLKCDIHPQWTIKRNKIISVTKANKQKQWNSRQNKA